MQQQIVDNIMWNWNYKTTEEAKKTQYHGINETDLINQTTVYM